VLVLKLLLIGATVYLSSMAARFGGHRLSGLITGLPMIVGPILALVLIDHGAQRTRDIALATLMCFPATLMHAVAFAQASRRWPWPACLLLATALYLAFAALLKLLALPFLGAGVLAALSPLAALRLMPAVEAGPGPAASSVRIPRQELFFRIAAAMAMAAAIIAGADFLPAFVSGLLLAVPIAGAVLPCFTLPRYGSAATVQLLRGFARGLYGFLAFIVMLCLLLPVLAAPLAFGLAVLSAPLAAWASSLAPVFRR
jgi:hypothetical protein